MTKPLTDLRAYLKHGGVIAYPTESCFGLGCDPHNRAAVQKILRLKHRPWHKGLILAAANLRQVRRYIQPLSLAQQHTLSQYWPGPYTFLLPISKRAPKCVTGKHRSLAVRVSAHPEVARLTRVHTVLHEAALLVDRRVGLRDDVPVLFPRGQVVRVRLGLGRLLLAGL